MRTIQLSFRTEEDWSGKFVSEESYDQLINESCRVLKPDGSLLCIVLKGQMDKAITAKAWSVLKDYKASTNNRGVAAGTGYVRQVKQDGTVSKTNRTPPEGVVNSGIIGYFERSVRFPYCRACAWNLQNPEKWAQLLPMVQEVSDLFGKFEPERFAAQQKVVEAASVDFVIPKTVFTTLTVNKNFRTACHKDAGDLPEGISCMSLIREGKYEGANLVFPDFRVGVKLDTFDLIIFDPHEFHGNTKLIPMSENYTRCTVVYYFRDGIRHCGSMNEEFDRVKNRQKGDALT